jgi:DNA invertase Pin-like site-specific DNA recombinase
MGRLTLNVLLSFAQFEREIAGERIRDKFRASRQKGMWMGGSVPLGYEVKDRALIINDVGQADQSAWLRRLTQVRGLGIPASSARNAAKLPARNQDLETRAAIAREKCLSEPMHSPAK